MTPSKWTIATSTLYGVLSLGMLTVIRLLEMSRGYGLGLYNRLCSPDPPTLRMSVADVMGISLALVQSSPVDCERLAW